MGSCFIVVPLDAARARDPRVFESTDARPDRPVEWASRERYFDWPYAKKEASATCLMQKNKIYAF